MEEGKENLFCPRSQLSIQIPDGLFSQLLSVQVSSIRPKGNLSRYKKRQDDLSLVVGQFNCESFLQIQNVKIQLFFFYDYVINL